MKCENRRVYTPEAFREEDPQTIRNILARYPLATLVTLGGDGLMATHLPMIYEPDPGPGGVLRGHMARANPQWQAGSEQPALAIFRGPDHYVSPAWYPSKQEHGRVVPTWNYVAVHAHGAVHYPEHPSWLLRNVQALTEVHEGVYGTGWKVADAPADFVDQMLKAIVGVELIVHRLVAKVKASQNRPRKDRERVAAVLDHLESSHAHEMAELIRRKIHGGRSSR